MSVYKTKITTKLGDKHHVIIDNFEIELVVNVNNKDEYVIDIYDCKGYVNSVYLNRNEKIG